MKTSSIVVVVMTFLAPSVLAQKGLVGYWNFDDIQGDVAEDSSGNENHATLVRGPQQVVGKFGGALNFDRAKQQMVEVPHSDSFATITDAVTMEAWVNPANFDSWVSFGEKGSGIDYGMFINPAAFVRMHYTAGGQLNTANNIIEANEWTHVVGTYDGRNVRIYINGEVQAETEATNQIPAGTGTYDIGATNKGRDWFTGMIDEVKLYNRGLTEAEVLKAMQGPSVELSADPQPEDGAVDVPRDADLNWTPGEFANTHDVYFGMAFNAVSDASRANPLGVLAGQNQGANAYDPAARLDFGQTYYWRIDEVNAAPDYTVFKGDVWSFTVEPFAYPIENITATASSSNKADEGSENTVNGSGLDEDDLHSTESTAMWLSSGVDPNATWIQYEFDRIYKLYQMSVWNYNTSVEPLIGFGIKEAIIEYSVDGATWAMLGTTHEFARGPGAAGYAPNTTVDFGGVAAKYVKITANSNWGGIVNQFGLSEVRFLSIPVLAREPSPISGATDVGVDATLSWRAGREAGRHDVYLSTDEQAVIDGTVPVAIVTEAGYAPSLDLAGTYYWRIDEINDVETPTTWQGGIWSLSTQEYLVVDDFESYNDIEAGQEGSNLIYWTWVDGFDNPTTNGSAIGYTVPFQPTMEAESVHGGDRSVPLTYDNSVANLSEVTVNTSDLAIGPDWTKGAPETLVLWFYGDAGNAVTEQMYVKVNNVKAVYDGDINNIVRRRWTQWNIDLASLGISLSNVTSLTIGFERTGASGGTGKVLIDDIRLYRVATPIPKPADPASTGLVAYYAMDNNAEDGSGNGNHGTLQGAPQWVEGLIGKALQFNGGTDYVEVADAPGLDIINTITIAAWIKANTFGNWRGFVVKGLETAPYAMQMWGDGSLRFGWNYGSPPGAVGNGLVNSNGKMPLGEWAHLAVTYDGSTLRFYINGGLDTQETDVSLVFGTNDEPLILGCDFPGGDEYFDGAMDDVRVYNRALSPSEVMFLGDLIP